MASAIWAMRQRYRGPYDGKFRTQPAMFQTCIRMRDFLKIFTRQRDQQSTPVGKSDSFVDIAADSSGEESGNRQWPLYHRSITEAKPACAVVTLGMNHPYGTWVSNDHPRIGQAMSDPTRMALSKYRFAGVEEFPAPVPDDIPLGQFSVKNQDPGEYPRTPVEPPIGVPDSSHRSLARAGI